MHLFYLLSFTCYLQMGMNPLGLILEPGKSRAQISADIIRSIYQRDGCRGFYRGYVASLCAYVPNSALWWGLYTSYQGNYFKMRAWKIS